MRQRILIAFATLLGALALTASSAYAGSSQTASASTAAGGQTVQAAAAESDAQATCRYRVNNSGGIQIRSSASNNGTIVGSLANGTTFYATCSNVDGGLYFDCGYLSDLWKWVGNGYVKTKCLVRI